MIKFVKGNDGVINLDGKLGSKAEILKSDNPHFYDSIEDGIKSTVRILIDNGFETCSSCQGHHDPAYCLRNVVIVMNEAELLAWRAMIAELNILKKFINPISYLIIDYNEKKGLMVIFGSVYNLDETEIKQRNFEEMVPRVRKEFYCKEFHDIADFTAKCGHVNSFTSNS